MLLFLGMSLTAQNQHAHHDSIKNLEEVKVKNATKKKIETEMKMAVSA